MQTTDIVTGSTEMHLVDLDSSFYEASNILVHREVVEPLQQLRNAAIDAGFDLAICSGFRSFERQLTIWNSKASGSRPIINASGHILDIETLSPWELVQAILRWSALPGASRHHWGTDLDIYDRSVMPEGYQIQLIPDEVEGSGLFAPMHNWLDGILNSNQSQFYRPYNVDLGGIAPERWHISYRPLAKVYTDQLTKELLQARLISSDILLLDVILEHLDEILARYILVD
jgi:LAS superfamily LD-carboxypeptidase LdcB